MMVHTSCRVYEFAEYEIRSVVIWRCTREHRNGHKDKATDGPNKGTAIEKRQEGVHEGIDDKRCESEGDVDEELVPTLRLVALA